MIRITNRLGNVKYEANGNIVAAPSHNGINLDLGSCGMYNSFRTGQEEAFLKILNFVQNNVGLRITENAQAQASLVRDYGIRLVINKGFQNTLLNRGEINGL